MHIVTVFTLDSSNNEDRLIDNIALLLVGSAVYLSYIVHLFATNGCSLEGITMIYLPLCKMRENM